MIIKSIKLKKLSSLHLLTGIALLTVSYAATADRVLEEIIVTAQKREQSLQDVPVSVSVIDGEFIKDAGLIDIQDVVQYVPNVKVNFDDLTPTITIRGFGTPPFGRALEPSVGLVIDDVYYGRMTYANDAVFDLQRLEVLRGPQGTLFGKNTIAGVMNFSTEPAGDELRGYLTTVYASSNDKLVEGGISVPLLADRLSSRFSFKSRSQDRHIFNTATNRTPSNDYLAGRIKLAFHAAETLDVYINAWAARSEGRGSNLEILKATPDAEEEFLEHDPQFDSIPFNERGSLDERGFKERDADSMSIKLSWSPDAESWGVTDNQIDVIAAWSEISTPFSDDVDFSPIPLIRLNSILPETYKQETLELRWSGSTPAPFGWGEGVDIIIGVYAFATESDVTGRFSINMNGVQSLFEAGGGVGPTGQLGIFADQVGDLLASMPNNGTPGEFPPGFDTEIIDNFTQQTDEGFAIFMQSVWHFTDRLNMTLGIRYGENSKEGQISSTAYGVSGQQGTSVAAPLLAQSDFDENRVREENELSPKIAFAYDWSDDLNIYTSFTEGFKGGGFAALAFNNESLEYEPEEGQAYEAGFKAKLLDGSLGINGAIYLNDFQNLQVRVFNGATFFFLNAGSARTQGFEMDATWLPSWEWLTIAGSLGYSDAYYVSYVNGPAQAGSGESRQDLSGESLVFAPEMSASLTPTIRFPLGDSGDIGMVIALDTLYQGEHWVDADIDPQARQEATTKFNLRLGVVATDGSWSVMASARNVTGEQEKLLVLDVPLLPGNYVTANNPDEPQFALNLRYAFE
jgi:iron complex outermembrane receptor protein